MNDWTPIDTGNAVTVLEFPNRTHLEQARLLEWVWVIDLSRFVRMSNPTETLSEKQFNDLYADLNLGIEPSKVIREVNRKDRVVYRIDSFPEERERFVTIEDGHRALNSFPHPPMEVPATVRSVPDAALGLFLGRLLSCLH